MCGRYSLQVPEKEIITYYRSRRDSLRGGYRPSYNAAPSQDMPVATAEGIEMMHWGLVPSWAKEFTTKYPTFNARAETVAEKASFRAPFKRHRALIPANGFYEWDKLGKTKTPYYFSLPDRELFSFAGLFDIWKSPDGQERLSYTIITTTPTDALKDIHDRSPVILERDEEEHWLDPDGDPDELQLLLRPYEGKMRRHEVSGEVGNVRNNHEGLNGAVNSA